MQSTVGTSHADLDYDIASATTFVSINHSGAVIPQATSGEEYTMQGLFGRLTGSGARFSGCTGDGSVDFFGGKTPTSAVLSNVARDGQPTPDSWSYRPPMGHRSRRRSRLSISRCRGRGWLRVPSRFDDIRVLMFGWRRGAQLESGRQSAAIVDIARVHALYVRMRRNG